VNFEQLLSKAKEIKEMLRRPGEIEPGGLEEEKEEKVEEEGAPEEPVEEAPAEEISTLEAVDETIKMKPGEEVEMEPVPEEKEEAGIEEAKAEEAPVGDEEPEEEISPLEAMDATIKIKPGEEVEMEPVPEEKEEPGIEEAKAEEAPAAAEEAEKAAQEEKRDAGGEVADVSGYPKRRASDALDILERYKKTEPEEEAEVIYYENDDKKILDSEYIVSAVFSRLEEAEKLYKKLSKTESPIDQFFVKQEIIRSQEALRGVILAGTRMLEKESCTLPEYTIGVMNMDVLKETLEKLSMQNWSKKTDFNLFNEYATRLKKDFYARISVLVDYLKSLLDELGLEF
jgi:translation initiation factor 2 beta subunit (eIF-2beta)/eIF-5